MDRVIIIGMGEVGSRLAGALGKAGVDVRPVTRSSGWPEAENDPAAPRIICVREDAVEEVFSRLSGVPSHLLVAVQNGWLRPVLGDREVTRGLIWFMSKSDFFRELRPSPFYGPLAGNLVQALARGGLSVIAIGKPEFDRADADKMGFNCVVGLPLAVHGVSLGEYLEHHADEAEALFTESVSVCAAAAGCTVNDRGWPDFLESVKPLDWVRTSKAKALDFRNGAVTQLGRKLGIATPINDRLLRES